MNSSSSLSRLEQALVAIEREHGDFDLFSFGKDGKAGGEDENADITNW